MKGVLILVLLVVVGFLLYTQFASKSSEDTPYATVKGFIIAASNNNTVEAGNLCVDAAKDSGEKAAAQIASMSLDTSNISFQNMTPEQYGAKGVMAIVSGQIIATELIQENDEWKIIKIEVQSQ